MSEEQNNKKSTTVRLNPEEIKALDSIVKEFYPDISGRSHAIKLAIAIISQISSEQLREWATTIVMSKRGRPANK